MKTALPLAAAFALLAQPTLAFSLDDIAKGTLLTGWRTADGTHMAALRVTLAEGWKTYWRAPGEGGIPPQFDWTGSGNLVAVTPSWPVPDVFLQNGLQSVGYVGVMTLPLAFRPENDSQDITVSGEIQIGVCEEICIPMTLSITAVLPHSTTTSDPAIVTAMEDRPMTRQEAGVRSVSCRIEPISDGMRVSAEINMPRIGRNEATVIELMDLPVWVSPPDVRRERGVLHASADLVPAEGVPFALQRDNLRFTVLAGGEAVDIRGCN